MKTILLGLLVAGNLCQAVPSDEEVHWEKVDPTRAFRASYPDAQVDVPAWNGKGKKGATFPLERQEVPLPRFKLFFSRTDPQGADFDDFLGESPGKREPVPVEFILVKTDEDGREVGHLMLGKWIHETGEIVDLNRPKILEWTPRMHTAVKRFTGGALTGAELRAAISYRLSDRASVRKFFIPRHFEFKELPRVIQFFPMADASLVIIAKTDPAYARQMRRDYMERKAVIPPSEDLKAVWSWKRACSRWILNVLSRF